MEKEKGCFNCDYFEDDVCLYKKENDIEMCCYFFWEPKKEETITIARGRNWDMQTEEEKKILFKSDEHRDKFVDDVFTADFGSIFCNSKEEIKKRIKQKGYVKKTEIEKAKEEYKNCEYRCEDERSVICLKPLREYIKLLEKEIERLNNDKG